jgi:hypothetical protein
MLPFAADWRWLRKGDGSLWYPTMKLFRQERVGDWEGVMKVMFPVVIGIVTLEMVSDVMF